MMKKIGSNLLSLSVFALPAISMVAMSHHVSKKEQKKQDDMETFVKKNPGCKIVTTSNTLPAYPSFKYNTYNVVNQHGEQINIEDAVGKLVMK